MLVLTSEKGSQKTMLARNIASNSKDDQYYRNNHEEKTYKVAEAEEKNKYEMEARLCPQTESDVKIQSKRIVQRIVMHVRAAHSKECSSMDSVSQLIGPKVANRYSLISGLDVFRIISYFGTIAIVMLFLLTLIESSGSKQAR